MKNLKNKSKSLFKDKMIINIYKSINTRSSIINKY